MHTGWREKDDYTIGEIRKNLQNNKLDAFIPWNTAHIAYLSNYYDKVHINVLWEEMVAFIVIPLGQDAFTVGTHEHWLGLMEDGVCPWWLSQRHGTYEPGEETLKRLIALLKQKRLDRRRIGIEKKWMPAAILDFLETELPEADFVSADTLIPQMRFIKRDRERKLMKTAVDIGWRCMEAYMHAVRNGAERPEAELVRAKTALDYGGEFVGGPYQVSWTGGTPMTRAWWDAEARKKFDSSLGYKAWFGDTYDTLYYMTHLETLYQNYYSDLAWREFYGPEPNMEDMLKFGGRTVSYRDASRDFIIMRTVQREALNTIRPGMTHNEAKAAVEKYLDSDPETRRHITGYYIHGVGLEVHEEPVLGSAYSNSIPLDGPIYFLPGAVVSSEWFSNCWTVEDPFVMTENGWEPLAELRG